MYIPFLKFKKNEILSLKVLREEILDVITPFFDVPRIKDMNEDEFKKRIVMAGKDLERHWDIDKKFYLDTFDIDQNLRPDGICPYSYALQNLKNFKIIPVVGLDRDNDHMTFVESYIMKMQTKEMAIRFLYSDFENFSLIEDELGDLFDGLIELCDYVDIILDCRVIVDSKAEKIAYEASEFSNKFCTKYKCRKVIVTGSSIPSSITEVVQTNSETYFPRHEKKVWGKFNEAFNQELAIAVFGDYGVISPEYSDIDLDPRMLATISSPKAIYSLSGHHFAVRGGRFRTHIDGYDQYFDLARCITSKPFFRGAGFSSGDDYIHQKSQDIPKAGSPQTWIKNTLNSHFTYIVAELS